MNKLVQSTSLFLLLLTIIIIGSFHRETESDNKQLQHELSVKIDAARLEYKNFKYQWSIVKNEKIRCPLCGCDDIGFVKERTGEGFSIICKRCANKFSKWDSDAYMDRWCIKGKMDDIILQISSMKSKLERVKNRSNTGVNYVCNFWVALILTVGAACFYFWVIKL